MVSEVLIENLLWLLATISLIFAGYVYGRLQQLEEEVNTIHSEFSKLDHRLRGDERDDTFNGFMADTSRELHEINERLDRIEHEFKSENQQVKRHLDEISVYLSSTTTDDPTGRMFDEQTERWKDIREAGDS